MFAVIIATEVAFWVIVAAGLVVRYGLRMSRLSAAILVSAPVVDLVLLLVTAIDLRGGGEARNVHALAAVYIGVSVGFGHQIIQWADKQAAYRWAGGPKPAGKPTGRARVAYERAGILRHLLAWVVGCGVVGLLTLIVGDPERVRALHALIGFWAIVLGIDAVVAVSEIAKARKTTPQDARR